MLKCCQHCTTREKPGKPLKLCSGCRRIFYCSKQCQDAHWPQHKAQCRQWVQAAHNDPKRDEALRRQDEWLQDNGTLLSGLLFAALGEEKLGTHVVHVMTGYSPHLKPHFQVGACSTARKP